MIINTLDNNKDKFKIEICFDNIDELKELWCRLNIASNKIITYNEKHSDISNFDKELGDNYELFSTIDDKLISLGIKKERVY